ncbi:ABC transporter ATP-binding protein [Paenibacillus radicis (ex Xue et al. 2023)]|uniref:Dipeptide ABC transporter ATP-binding protein n=1 Tax=Paenibacillus radicis (ex Xue et al. 2023) TaxID=2972489 RepID=A0ABT1YIS0_9BACL|nr:dipeptide ABC transporter ATP-binding protein [Paenibacillus radicis (ex Xue et al. 2023)]MCR8632877.1 dipeptide ABC transporter ATP-binding protein [Paenibacillus radicis (ex Xue et al. 2023)]
MNSILEVKGLKKYFPIRGGILGKAQGYVKAVDDLSFFLQKGETLGIVGESGCGKSTAGRTILGLMEPTEGEVLFQGQNIFTLKGDALRKIRREMQIIFQDPYASLNPRMTIGSILEEPLKIHKLASAVQRVQQVKELLEIVGLTDQHYDRYPHEFSGGQRQRIGIARALITKPKLIIADEPVSALDVSVQSQILNLMKDLQAQFQLTFMFISHDLSVVRHISDRVGVMYLGRMVELAPKKMFYENPMHPYSQALLSAVPHPNPREKRERIILSDDVPSPANPPTGCAFHTRCHACMEICKTERPILKQTSDEHWIACHIY